MTQSSSYLITKNLGNNDVSKKSENKIQWVNGMDISINIFAFLLATAEQQRRAVIAKQQRQSSNVRAI